ncbi:ABC-2 family transporter protein [Clostridium puniceum]|uniref:ABC-2 family transporter protein n=1 Tax=Clostridium puniceum TaxID=29367 RepID=A0A1S8TY38_9CLOT|nr:ABC transporter permease subunit [Clostridium puniceum]OOM82610.1 ABC-2 family transporter protein [Clostridium puniceum]
MNLIRIGIINESTKLFKRSKYKIFVICIGILSIGLGLISNYTGGLVKVSLSNLPLNILSILNTALIPLVTFMAVADLFAAEQENGTIKAIITRPTSRSEILISKMISIWIYVISILIISFIIGSVMGVFFGRTEVIDIPEVFIAYVISILPIIPTIFLSILISQLSKSGSLSVMLSVLIYIILMLSGIIFPKVSSILFISYTNWYKLFIGAQMPIKSILVIVGLLMGYSLIFFSVAYELFERKEY